LTLKRLVLASWTMFFTMVALTNLVNLLAKLGASHWRFLNSGNFAYPRSAKSRHLEEELEAPARRRRGLSPWL
jgi:hypothetical protein